MRTFWGWLLTGSEPLAMGRQWLAHEARLGAYERYMRSQQAPGMALIVAGVAELRAETERILADRERRLARMSSNVVGMAERRQA